MTVMTVLLAGVAVSLGVVASTLAFFLVRARADVDYADDVIDEKIAEIERLTNEIGTLRGYSSMDMRAALWIADDVATYASQDPGDIVQLDDAIKRYWAARERANPGKADGPATATQWLGHDGGEDGYQPKHASGVLAPYVSYQNGPHTCRVSVDEQ